MIRSWRQVELHASPNEAMMYDNGISENIAFNTYAHLQCCRLRVESSLNHPENSSVTQHQKSVSLLTLKWHTKKITRSCFEAEDLSRHRQFFSWFFVFKSATFKARMFTNKNVSIVELVLIRINNENANGDRLHMTRLTTLSWANGDFFNSNEFIHRIHTYAAGLDNDACLFLVDCIKLCNN
jgi:hypothetical protein